MLAQGKKADAYRKFRPSNSFMVGKEEDMSISRKHLGTSEKKRRTIQPDIYQSQLNTSNDSKICNQVNPKLRQSQ